MAALLLSACTPGSSNEVERLEPVSIPFGELPSVTAAHDNYVYVADRRGNAIAKIDPSTNEVLLEREISDFVKPRWTIWDLDAAGGYLWATIPRAKRVLQLDPESLDLEREVQVAGFVTDLYPAAGALWFTAGAKRGVAIGRIDASSGKLLPERSLGPENTHVTDVVEFDGWVWLVTDHARYIDGGGPNPTFKVSAELWQIEPSTGRVIDKLSLGSTFARGGVNPVIGDVEVGAGGLWMSRLHERRVVLVDPSDSELLMQFYVAIFEYPWEFEVLDGDLWIGELNGRRLAHVDVQTRERRVLTLEAETSYLGSGFGSIWVPLLGPPPDGGTVVRLDKTVIEAEN